MIAIEWGKNPHKNTLFCQPQTFLSPTARKDENMQAIRRIRRALYNITYKRTKKTAGASFSLKLRNHQYHDCIVRQQIGGS